MWTVISICLIILTSVLGITQMLKSLWLWLIRPREDPSRVLLIFLRDDICIEQMKSALEYISWESNRTICCVAAVDSCLSDENKKKVAEFANGSSMIVVGQEAINECFCFPSILCER